METHDNQGFSHDEFKLNQTGFNMAMPGHQSNHPNDMVLRQEPRTARKEGSGISLPYETRLEMGLMLDEHLCALNVALHQYTKHHWLTEGAESFGSLHHILDEHIDVTQDHIDRVGERVARLGVVPTAHPVTQHEISYIKHEVEGRYTMRDYLRNDLEHEIKIQGMMRKTIKRAHSLNDFGTVQVLEDILLKREDLGYHLWSLLEDDSLVRGMTHLLDGQNDIASNRNLNPNLKQ
ncbi:Dps family protein [Halalkalibacter akibai]|uniref:Nutrient-stress induced DNA binding protein n=1 Tax=Halalkalibacter akibai (strain ATCC 43226 / DSM 21942 / CIP 109018 / JCM 9157 / 1139) TaxID=1236973 RepID=W4QQZ6_HALA3|nr:ferritin-like domain-containing protein [Halalkalibacter akibai]GAE34496.1 nutrient-stress induced DNA binding protein [Halalkalibacter akibai JCM 9157]